MSSATVNDLFLALTSESLSKEELQNVYEALSKFVEIFNSNKDIRSCLSNDIYPSSVKVNIIEEIVPESKHTRKFLETLIEFKLLKSFIDSREFFLKKLRVVLGRIKIEVTTIDTSQHAKLELIRQNLQSIWGQNIEINFIEYPNIIGGLLLQVEDKFFDGSLNGKITELKNLNFKGEL